MEILKDSIRCSCNSYMFPVRLDKEKQEITYKCINCGREETNSIKDVILKPNENIEFFTLTDSGEMSWKSYRGYGYCRAEVGTSIKNFVEFPEIRDFLWTQEDFELYDTDFHPVLDFPIVKGGHQ